MSTIIKQLWTERNILKFMFLQLFLINSFSSGNADDKYLYIPPIVCPDYFQYVMRRDGYFFGKLVLPDLKLGRTTVEVQFSQQVPLESDYHGRISLIQDDENSGFSFNIDFPMEKVLPKLTKIIVNDKAICSTSGYNAPSTSFKLQHIISVAVPEDTREPEVKLNETTEKPSQFPINWLLEGVCGHEGPEQGQGSILKRGEYPWLAAINKKQLTRSKFISGGSLISARTIVTAAHYLMQNNLTAPDISVSLGRYNLSNFSESGFIELDVGTLLIHPEYKSGYRHADADIALLQLLEPVVFTQLIRPVCLWNTNTDEAIVGKSAIVAGWKVMGDYETEVLLPKKAHASVVSQATCLQSLPAYSALTSTRTLCAGKRDGTGPCGGGDGLMVNRCGRWTLRAIASAGIGKGSKCDLGQYVVYCDLNKHKSWIQAHILI